MRETLSIIAFLLTLSPFAAAQQADAVPASTEQDTVVVALAQAPSDSVEAAMTPADSAAALMAKVDSMLYFADAFMGTYNFDKAEEFLKTARLLCPHDSLTADIDAEAVRARTARRLTSSTYAPKVVARQMLCIDDFFLYYPLPDKSWHPVESAPAIFCPDAGDEVHVSGSGAKQMLYPMYCGNRMYFSSADLPGIGGYDLFCCEWNEEAGEWGEPKNMGFPFNSVADDFLFINTEDGKYSIFSSNRDCPADSVYTYVVEYCETPAAEAVFDKSKLHEMSRLEPTAEPDQLDLGSLDGEGFFDADTKVIRAGAYTFTLKTMGQKVKVVYFNDL